MFMQISKRAVFSSLHVDYKINYKNIPSFLRYHNEQKLMNSCRYYFSTHLEKEKRMKLNKQSSQQI
jgi:hypothetical protein